jgi:hypothetical protein
MQNGIFCRTRYPWRIAANFSGPKLQRLVTRGTGAVCGTTPPTSTAGRLHVPATELANLVTSPGANVSPGADDSR